MRILFFLLFMTLMSVPLLGKDLSPDKAIRLLSKGSPEEVEEAIASLRIVPNLIKNYSKSLAQVVTSSPNNIEVAKRILSLVGDRGQEGCVFIARLMTKTNRAWVSQVIMNYRAYQGCEGLHLAFLRAFEWIPYPGTNEDQELLKKMLSIVREDKDKGIGERICRFILEGPKEVRKDAIFTILTVWPEGGESCLIRAFTDEMNKKESDTEIRHELLRAIANSSGVDSLPTLIAALQREEDREVACDLLIGAGKQGIDRMVFAVKIGDERPTWCLKKAGDKAIESVIPMLDHHLERTRRFALDFLAIYRSEKALEILKERFFRGSNLPKSALLTALAGYPGEKVSDVFVTALIDADPEIRIHAISAVEKNHHLVFSGLLLKTAEEDPSPRVRARALMAMWRLGDDSVVPLASRMLQYEVGEVIATAAFVLGFLGDQKTVEILAPLVNHKDKAIAEAITNALWLLSYENPKRKSVRYEKGPELPKLAKAKKMELEACDAFILGKKEPLVIVIPGGLGMDFSWARPFLDDLRDDVTLAFLSPIDQNELVTEAMVTSLLKALKRTKAVILSHGIGASLGLILAMKKPNEIVGVVAIGGSLPSASVTVDDTIPTFLKPPFKEFFENIQKDIEVFHPKALNRYVPRIFATVWGGKKGEPTDVLGLTYNHELYMKAVQEVRKAGKLDMREYPGSVLFIGPYGVIPEDASRPIQELSEAVKERITVESLNDCGFYPEVVCTSKVLKTIVRFLERFQVK